ncbi:2'-5' RNA ligase family protein [Streptomyces sp. NPDC101237]|uniref:2'-5' RNA ligase family protein n=1 Tax=Streptomyces sp. NPDC101237 TaxID=3366139 RepID=UPI003802C1B0
MAQALVMFLDAAANVAIDELRDQLAHHGLAGKATSTSPRHRPHISLAVAEAITLSDSSLTRRIARQRLDLRMELVGAFAGPQGILFLGVTVTQPLLEAHAAVHSSMTADGGGPWGHFRPGVWVPHCTLVSGLGGHALGKAVSLLHPFPELAAHVSTIEIVDTQTGAAVAPSL